MKSAACAAAVHSLLRGRSLCPKPGPTKGNHKFERTARRVTAVAVTMAEKPSAGHRHKNPLNATTPT